MITPYFSFSYSGRISTNAKARNRTSMTLYWLLILTVGLGSCATSSGGTYSRSVDNESNAASRAAAAKKERQDSHPVDSGNQDWSTTGSYQDNNNESSTLIFAIAAPSGTIQVQGAPVGAELMVDDYPVSYFTPAGNGTQAAAKVPAGQYRVRVEFFGYSDWEADIQVDARSTISLLAELKTVSFSLSAPSTGPLLFDPSRPGMAGTAKAIFSATAPGSVSARVIDRSGRSIRDLGSRDITGPSVPVSWDGRDDAGLIVPAGDYTLELAGTGADARGGLVASIASLPVTLASLGPLRAASLHGGFSGAMLAPDTLILPPDSIQLSLGTYAFVDMRDGSPRARLPIWTGLRFGGFPYPAAEVAVSLTVIDYPGYETQPPLDAFTAAASLKSPLFAGDYLASALLLRAAVGSFSDETVSGWPSSWDSAASYPGVGAGLVFQWTPGGPGGAERLFASAEMSAGRFYPGYGADDGTGVWEVPGFFTWPYLRAGVESLLDAGEAGHLSVQGSVAARGQPVGTISGFRPPLSLAGDLAWYPPVAPFVLHLYALGEWEGFYSWYFAGGAGISILY